MNLGTVSAVCALCLCSVAPCIAAAQFLQLRPLPPALYRTAENVSVKDKLEEGAKVDLIEGQLEQSVYSIDAGRSADFKYVVIPRSGQAAFEASPAEVTYTSSEGMPPTKLLSTSSHVKVLSWAQNVERKLVTLVRPRHVHPTTCPRLRGAPRAASAACSSTLPRLRCSNSLAC